MKRAFLFTKFNKFSISEILILKNLEILTNNRSDGKFSEKYGHQH